MAALLYPYCTPTYYYFTYFISQSHHFQASFRLDKLHQYCPWAYYVQLHQLPSIGWMIGKNSQLMNTSG